VRVPDLGEGRQTPEQAKGRVGGQRCRGTIRGDVECVCLIAGTERSSCFVRDGFRVLAEHNQRTELFRVSNSGDVYQSATNHETFVFVTVDVVKGTSDGTLEVTGVWTVDLDVESGREHEPSRSSFE